MPFIPTPFLPISLSSLLHLILHPYSQAPPAWAAFGIPPPTVTLGWLFWLGEHEQKERGLNTACNCKKNGQTHWGTQWSFSKPGCGLCYLICSKVFKDLVQVWKEVTSAGPATRIFYLSMSIQLLISIQTLFCNSLNVQCKWRRLKAKEQHQLCLSLAVKRMLLLMRKMQYFLFLWLSCDHLENCLNCPNFPACWAHPNNLTGAAKGDWSAEFFPPTQSLFHESDQFLGMHVCGLESPGANYFCTKYCNSVWEEMKASPKEGLERDFSSF